MRKSAIVAVLGLLPLFTTGCGNSGGEAESTATVTGRVAVVDLDLIAKQLGRDVEMTTALKQQQETLVEELKAVQANFTKQINDKKSEFTQVGYTESQGDQFGTQKASATGDYTDQKTELAAATDELTAEESRQLVGMAREATVKLNQARQNAGTVLNQRRAQLVSNFRQEVKPIALSVAKEKGLSIVLTKNDSVLFAHEDTIDITGEIVSRMKSSGK